MYIYITIRKIYINMKKLNLYRTEFSKTKGRYFLEDESLYRNPFMRDRDRLIHSAAFRRLEHKTQVFVQHEGDNFRSRLTHTIEVAQIARTIASRLGLDPDLAETIALAHDLGHTPFGHAGEDALNKSMIGKGGFDHNAQTLRIVTKLEKKYAEFDGLNLTWESLEGIVKHNGPLSGKIPTVVKEYQNLIKMSNEKLDLKLDKFAGPEAQVAAISDDIAYCNHDIDDGLRAGLFELDSLEDIEHVAKVINSNRIRWKNIEKKRLIHETIRKLINNMIEDVVTEYKIIINKNKFNSSDDIRNHNTKVIRFSKNMYEDNQKLRKFLFEKMYKHTIVNRMTLKAKSIVEELFNAFSSDITILPSEWREIAENAKSDNDLYRTISDYIAGMTDRYAVMEHKRLYDLHGGWTGTSLYDKRDR
ncbi:MAG: Deoxyguanosinetriphosphate triphosphohydrolase-like protein [Alphaproteobacteria bacterium MarineAlpha9_Bin3]|nr:MAG: Deoxyguanosinetriphosphate triphosphohydrolase-like protein [Alphaproteobacteria bacterium MarineAlpha9_Bin3]